MGEWHAERLGHKEAGAVSNEFVTRLAPSTARGGRGGPAAAAGGMGVSNQFGSHPSRDLG